MARIDISKLTQNATALSSRALEAHQDPAVQKAGSKAWRDAARAAKSVSEYGSEFGAAWRRLGSGDTAAVEGLLA